MRKPTPLSEVYAWHAAALRGDAPPIHETPECGWFRRKLIRHGPWVGGRISMVQDICQVTGELLADEYLECVVNGRERDPQKEWLSLCKHPISESEYLYMVDLADYAREHAPKEPIASPNRRVNWLDVPMPKFRSDKG